VGTEDGTKNFNKLEKADILELAVEQLQTLQKQNNAAGMWKFRRVGFSFGFLFAF